MSFYAKLIVLERESVWKVLKVEVLKFMKLKVSAMIPVKYYLCKNVL